MFTGDTGGKYGYEDAFDEAGVFSYCGKGQVGDMQFKSGNKAIRDHATDGRALHLFKSLGKGKRHRYLGEFVLANHSIRQGPDRNGDLRDVIVFHLLPVDALQDLLPVSGPTSQGVPATLEEARRRAVAASTSSSGAAGKTAVKTLYERCREVRDYVLLRASGACESCLAQAPFMSAQGSPFLEVHHISRLSDGGLDHPMHTAAVCPNCHREVHLGIEGVSKNKALEAKIASNW